MSAAVASWLRAPSAHVVQSANIPGVLPWLLAVIAVGGLVAAFALRSRWLRRASLAVSAVGVAAIVVVDTVFAGPPSAPLPAIRLASPQSGAATTSPLWVRVCSPPGSQDATASGRLVAVSVDGVLQGDHATSAFALTLSAGTHRLAVQLVDAAHRGFRPALTAQASVGITHAAPLSATAPGC